MLDPFRALLFSLLCSSFFLSSPSTVSFALGLRPGWGLERGGRAGCLPCSGPPQPSACSPRYCALLLITPTLHTYMFIPLILCLCAPSLFFPLS